MRVFVTFFFRHADQVLLRIAFIFFNDRIKDIKKVAKLSLAFTNSILRETFDFCSNQRFCMSFECPFVS